MCKRALITTIAGQGGFYLTELLLAKDYEVVGLKRLSSLCNTDQVNHLYVDYTGHQSLLLSYSDLIDASSIIRRTQENQSEEIHNLAAQSRCRVHRLGLKHIARPRTATRVRADKQLTCIPLAKMSASPRT
jgi:GDPmannose 4,6-dehydratase